MVKKPKIKRSLKVKKRSKCQIFSKNSNFDEEILIKQSQFVIV